MSVTAPPEPAVRVDRLDGRDHRLDGLRALAALAVIITHVGDWTDSVTSPHGAWIQELNVGVDVFFVISAVLLYAPFVASHLDGRPHPTLRTYTIRRFLRIFPAYWVALLVILPLSPIFGLRGPWQWFSVPTLVYTYRAAGLGANIGLRQGWTLVIEISFYAFLPFYAFAIRELGRRVGALRAEVIGAVALLIGGPACFWFASRDAWFQLPSLLRVLPPSLGIFATGMLIVIAREAVARMPRAPQWWVILGASTVPWYAAALIAYWAICEKIGISPTLAALITARQQWEQHLLQTVVAACVVAPAVFVPAGRSWSLRIVGSRPLAFIGMISYGIYLWHIPVILVAQQLAVLPAQLLPRLLVVLLPTLVLATLSWVLLERPIMLRAAART